MSSPEPKSNLRSERVAVSPPIRRLPPDVRLDNAAIVTDSRATDMFEVDFVCTGNRARSPLAEALYRRYAGGLDTRARSFGTLDVGSAPALEHAVEAGRTMGVDLRNHSSVVLAHGALSESDLVLGFEPHHVAAAVIDGAAAPGRAFLLREFAELIEQAGPADGTVRNARFQVTAAAARRPTPSVGAARFVIEDPVGRPSSAMYATAEEINELVRRVVASLFGRRTRP
jgi:protein-tyrosine-phosphatase